MNQKLDPLKFVVLDEEDLEIVSTHLQDAVVKVSDILWRPQENRLVVALNRFDWESAQTAKPEFRRRRAALRFERVMSCQGRNVSPAGTDAVLNLLAVEFAETDDPSGVVTLIFSGGAALRLDVECLEGELADLGPSWTAATCPAHALADEAPPKK
jgi:dipeptidyl aminopeptidase/acylaminoacyl peptidase